MNRTNSGKVNTAELRKAIKLEIKKNKSTFAVYTFLWIAVIAVMVLQILNRNYENVFLSRRESQMIGIF